MPSPFPGMDPYLEAKDQWPVAHSALIYCCYAALNAVLPPQYRARMEERVYIIEPPLPGAGGVSDGAVVRRPDAPATGAVAVLPPPAEGTAEEDAPMLLRAGRPTARERYIDIVSLRSRGRVVTTIEVLSPANKRPGAGREEYVRKQQAVLDSETHLLEIDLLRQGDHTVAAPASGMLLEHGPWHYAFSLHRAGAGDLFEAWARSVRERFPRLRVPLSDGAPDVLLDLAAVFTRVYDEGEFGREIDYAVEPEPPLSPEDAAWADALLRKKGLRP